MGRSFESWALRQTPLEPVREALEEWLKDRGLVSGPPNAADHVFSEDSCRVVLFHNSDWTIILTSNPFTDSDAIDERLGKIPAPLLRAWAYDSDIWGYELHVGDQLRASFNSSPNYFGVPTDQPLPKNGDPDELASALNMPGLARKVSKIQGGKSLFSEWRVEKFAEALCALPLALETQMVPAYLRQNDQQLQGGYRVVVMDYVKPREQMRLVDLHLDYGPGQSRFAGEFPGAPPIDPATMRQIEQMQKAFRFVGWVLKPFFWTAGLVIRPLIRNAAVEIMGGKSRVKEVEGITGLMRELQALAVPMMRQEGPWVVNPHLGYRVRGRMTPDAAEHPTPGMIFSLQVLDSNVNCTMLAPEQVRMMLSHAVAGSGDDLKHYLGDYQARTMFSSLPAPMKVTTAQTLIRLDDALLMFGASFKDADPRAVRKEWDEMINSFEVRPR